VITRNEQVSGSSPLVGSLCSLHWLQDIEAEKPRCTAFAEGSEPKHDDLASMRNCIRLDGLTFRALLSEGGEQLELVRV